MVCIYAAVCPLPTKLSTAWPGANGYLFCANMAGILLFVIYLYRKNKRIHLKELFTIMENKQIL